MFYVPEKLRLNSFKQCHVARARDLFQRYGRFDSVPTSSDGQVIPMNMNKLDSLEYLDKYDAYQAELERQKQTVNDSSSEPHEVKSNEVSEES